MVDIDNIINPIGTISSIGLYVENPVPKSVNYNEFKVFYDLNLDEISIDLSNECVMSIIERVVLMQQRLNRLELKKLETIGSNPHLSKLSRARAYMTFIVKLYFEKTNINFRDCVYLKIPLKLLSYIAFLPCVLLLNMILILIRVAEVGMNFSKRDDALINEWLLNAYSLQKIDWVSINKRALHELEQLSNEFEKRFGVYGEKRVHTVKMNEKYFKIYAFHIVSDIENTLDNDRMSMSIFDTTSENHCWCDLDAIYLKMFTYCSECG